jgi:hypothetical protein
MPPFSDPPYLSNCLLNAFASTFERYPNPPARKMKNLVVLDKSSR